MIRLWVPDDYLPSEQLKWWEPEAVTPEDCPYNTQVITWYRRRLETPSTVAWIFYEDCICYNDIENVYHKLSLLAGDPMTWRISKIATVSCMEEAEHIVDIILKRENWTNDAPTYDIHWNLIEE